MIYAGQAEWQGATDKYIEKRGYYCRNVAVTWCLPQIMDENIMKNTDKDMRQPAIDASV